MAARSIIVKMLTQILSLLKRNTKEPKNMSPKESGEKPLSYHHYWMVYAKKLLDNTIPNFKQKIENYKTFLDSLTGAILIGGITWTAYVNTTNLYVFLLIFGPIVFLQLARLIISVMLDRTDVYQIEDITDATQVHLAHNVIVSAISKKATYSKVPVFIATLLFLICIPTGIFLHNLDRNKKKEEVKISFMSDDIYISAITPKATKSLITFIGKDEKGKLKKLTKNISFDNPGVMNLHFNENILGFKISEILFEYTVDKEVKAIVKRRPTKQKSD